jgi:hypothetical protein
MEWLGNSFKTCMGANSDWNQTAMRQVWTILLTGGESFSGVLSISQMFPVQIEHHGKRTLLSVRLTSDELQQLENVLHQKGIKTKIFTTEESPEQQDVRRRIHQADKLIYPTAQCPNCFWLDLESDLLCGYMAWDVSMVEDMLQTYQKAQSDINGCSRYEWHDV